MDKIVCIGKNYPDHVKEMAQIENWIPGQARNDNHSPVIFLKPPSILQTIKNLHTGKLKYPSNFGALHYETEIILRIHKECYKVTPEDGHQYFNAVSIGLDMTLRDLQTAQKKQGFPWTTSKVFPDSAVCGEWIELAKFSDFENKLFSFTLNGVQRQSGKANDMILSCSQCVSYISQFFKLLPGDMIYTGTPAGVGEVKIGDVAQLQYHTVNYNVEWVL